MIPAVYEPELKAKLVLYFPPKPKQVEAVVLEMSGALSIIGALDNPETEYVSSLKLRAVKATPFCDKAAD